MKTLLVSVAVAAMLAVGSLGDTWPSDSCVVSGTTNRTCAAVAAQPLSTSLDSYWLGIGSGTLAKSFYTRAATGFILIFK